MAAIILVYPSGGAENPYLIRIIGLPEALARRKNQHSGSGNPMEKMPHLVDF